MLTVNVTLSKIPSTTPADIKANAHRSVQVVEPVGSHFPGCFTPKRGQDTQTVFKSLHKPVI